MSENEILDHYREFASMAQGDNSVQLNPKTEFGENLQAEGEELLSQFYDGSSPNAGKIGIFNASSILINPPKLDRFIDTNSSCVGDIDIIEGIRGSKIEEDGIQLLTALLTCPPDVFDKIFSNIEKEVDENLQL